MKFEELRQPEESKQERTFELETIPEELLNMSLAEEEEVALQRAETLAEAGKAVVEVKVDASGKLEAIRVKMRDTDETIFYTRIHPADPLHGEQRERKSN